MKKHLIALIAPLLLSASLGLLLAAIVALNVERDHPSFAVQVKPAADVACLESSRIKAEAIRYHREALDRVMAQARLELQSGKGSLEPLIRAQAKAL